MDSLLSINDSHDGTGEQIDGPQRAHDAGGALWGDPAEGASSGEVELTEGVDDVSASACPSYTLMQSSQEGEVNSVCGSSPSTTTTNPSLSLPFPFCNAVFAADWLECGAVAIWDDDAGQESFWMLSRMQDEAKSNGNKPVPLNLKGRSMLLYPKGMGTGSQSRMDYRLEYSGITVGASARDNADRKLSNFYYKIPGEVCLLMGAAEARQIVQEIAEALGGVIVDEWIRRIDLCLDLPEFDLLDELMVSFEQSHFVSTAKRWNAWDGVSGKTGFTVGSRGRVLLNVYNKLLDTFARHDGVYQLAMKERRWGGKIPEAATRVEYQLAGEWLRSLGLKSTDTVLRSLASVVAKVAGSPPRAFFCLTDRDPDAANHHQSRARVLPSWKHVIDAMQHHAGIPGPELKPLQRGNATVKQIWNMVRAYLVSGAASLGHIIENLDDAKNVLGLLAERNDCCDADLFDRWSAKARKLGTLDEVLRFMPPRDEGFA